MNEFISFIILFPIIYYVFIFSFAFIDYFLRLGLCSKYFRDIFYYTKCVRSSPSPLKICYSNQNYIRSAVEMYNFDHSEVMTSLDQEELIRKGYIKKKIDKPTKKCIYRIDGDLTDSGTLYC